jgi:membrane associated rhomboid family serine protease
MQRLQNAKRRSEKTQSFHTKEAIWRSLGLVAIFVVIFVVQVLIGVDESVMRAGLVKSVTREGEYWRLITAPFMHASARHLLMNAYAAFFFGILVELYGGQWLLLPLFLASAIGGSVASLLLLSAASVGASGGLMGFLGFLLVAWLRRGRSLPKDFGIGLAKAIVPTAVIGLVAWRQIDNAAHLGGFLTGAVIGVACFLPSSGKLPLPSTSLTNRLDRVSQFSIGCAACWALFALVK